MSWLRKVIAGLLMLAALVVLCFAGLYGYAWKQRLLAGKLLSAVRTMQPGVSTEAQYEAAVQPFAKQVIEIQQEGSGGKFVAVPSGFAVANEPEWVFAAVRRIPWVGDLGTRGAYFSVEPKFLDGTLSSLHLEEMQMISGHAPGAFVRIMSNKSRDSESDILDEKGGYWFQSMQIGDGIPAWEQFVTLDERATPREREAALNFDFACFTAIHNCLDGGKMLRPAPSRAGETR